MPVRIYFLMMYGSTFYYILLLILPKSLINVWSQSIGSGCVEFCESSPQPIREGECVIVQRHVSPGYGAEALRSECSLLCPAQHKKHLCSLFLTRPIRLYIWAFISATEVENFGF